MITIILLGIIGAIIGGRGWYKDFGLEVEVFMFGFFGLMFGCFIGFITAIALPTEVLKEDSPNIKELVSLQDGSSVSGNFFLGCGSINGSMKYTYYYEVEKDLFKMGRTDYDRVLIKYDSIPRLETFRYVQTDYWLNWFSIDLGQIKPQYIFHVPKGTIKNDYNLDAQ
tara:strand:+ start:43 stop:546 length:504 start_codon:yes stop_codon:yes gene_type:complete